MRTKSKWAFFTGSYFFRKSLIFCFAAFVRFRFSVFALLFGEPDALAFDHGQALGRLVAGHVLVGHFFEDGRQVEHLVSGSENRFRWLQGPRLLFFRWRFARRDMVNTICLYWRHPFASMVLKWWQHYIFFKANRAPLSQQRLFWGTWWRHQSVFCSTQKLFWIISLTHT